MILSGVLAANICPPRGGSGPAAEAASIPSLIRRGLAPRGTTVAFHILPGNDKEQYDAAVAYLEAHPDAKVRILGGYTSDGKFSERSPLDSRAQKLKLSCRGDRDQTVLVHGPGDFVLATKKDLDQPVGADNPGSSIDIVILPG